MERKGTYIVKTHHGEVGLYAGVELIIRTFENNDLLDVRIDYPDRHHDLLVSSVKFGCYNAFENLTRIGIPSTGYVVTVEKVHWHNMDSSSAILAMAANKAVQNAFGSEEIFGCPKLIERKVTFSHWFSWIDM